jgi:xanthine dehydrogenase accessory factor
MTVDQDGTLRGTLGDPDLDRALVDAATEALRRGTSRTVELGGRSLFIEAYPVRPRMIIVGATETARALVDIAGALGYERIVIDARPAFAAAERFPDVERLINGWPDDAFATIDLGPDDTVAVLTHDPKFDEPAIVEAVRRGARYVGAIGSRKTQANRRGRLRDAGLTDDEIARVRGPIGLDLGGRAPAETALAIMAEVVAMRYGATGGSKAEGAAKEPAMAGRGA